MFNLSDKELDRLSREAAQEHDPGPLLGSRSWENLEGRLDKELGRFNPGPMRGFRRLPFYYAPAILLLIGVSYFLIKPGKNNNPPPASAAPQVNPTEPTGSPPESLSIVKSGKPENRISDPSPKTTDHSYNSTSEPEKDKANGNPAPRNGNSAPRNGNRADIKDPDLSPDPARRNPSSVNPSTEGPAAENRTGAGKDLSAENSSRRNAENDSRTFLKSKGASDKVKGAKNRQTAAGKHPGLAGGREIPAGGAEEGLEGRSGIRPSSGIINSAGAQKNLTQKKDIAQKKEAQRSAILASRLALRPPRVDDSALRAFTAIAPPIPVEKKKALHINRSLQFGVVVAPDFSSVHSQAGDKPGSSIGVTVDYQFSNRWYLGSGLLYSRKNYSARADDYHVPMGFYQYNGLHNVNFIKGSFSMLEIPLNLRYDFSVVNNTTFFVSGGVSSYLLTNEKTNYYYDFFGIEACKPFEYRLHESYLFSAANLSLGVETGISNDFSILVAPYMKFPLSGGGVGFGQVKMTSIGINFSLKYAPVLSRKRH